MARQLKVYTGVAIAHPATAAAVGQHHHVGQVTVYVAATSKDAARDALKQVGMDVPAARFYQANSMHAAALAEAGQFATPIVLVTHLHSIGPVARIADDRSLTIVGQLDHRTHGSGHRRLHEDRMHFTPAPESQKG